VWASEVSQCKTNTDPWQRPTGPLNIRPHSDKLSTSCVKCKSGANENNLNSLIRNIVTHDKTSIIQTSNMTAYSNGNSQFNVPPTNSHSFSKQENVHALKVYSWLHSTNSDDYGTTSLTTLCSVQFKTVDRMRLTSHCVAWQCTSHIWQRRCSQMHHPPYSLHRTLSSHHVCSLFQLGIPNLGFSQLSSSYSYSN